MLLSLFLLADIALLKVKIKDLDNLYKGINWFITFTRFKVSKTVSKRIK
jgi:hypothetical protein